MIQLIHILKMQMNILPSENKDNDYDNYGTYNLEEVEFFEISFEN